MRICDTYHSAMQSGAGRSGRRRHGDGTGGAGGALKRKVKAMNEKTVRGKLVDAHGLLDELFVPACRPSLRWLRTQTRSRAIPHVKIGHLVFFDVEVVRRALGKNPVLRGRSRGTRGGARGAGDLGVGRPDAAEGWLRKQGPRTGARANAQAS